MPLSLVYEAFWTVAEEVADATSKFLNIPRARRSLEGACEPRVSCFCMRNSKHLADEAVWDAEPRYVVVMLDEALVVAAEW